MPTAILFPGQGSQTPDMRDRVADVRPDLLDLVTEVVGEDPFPRADEDTRYAQPAILVAGLAGHAALKDELGERPLAVAGHSLGELTALAVAQAISERDAIRLAALRGRLMSESGARRGDGTMLAALGGDDATVVRIAEAHGAIVANDNAPGQLVLSGERAAQRDAGTELRGNGVRILELNVAGAFPSPFMADAVPDFADALNATYVRKPRIEVWSCVTARPVDDIRRRLAEGLTAPVRWRETVLGLQAAGVDRFVDVGPGQVLAKLVKRIAKSAAEEPASV
jgi:malonyl CoA-acyl carrier protein transacylase